ncbi:MFS transporter [Pseudoclavibacter chungangensis]|uniref:MFS transporter n=1 Tax=Pseudoclavibacter chungangensis TaxID=587635 RepID=A0A7J5BTS9_9MICO|nr:MDR family MFS transporter [Pseudoclavibacter chungangensis]KAB1656896.1 MFS transporter [Pseudoclavibacter chungangensis]NYJ67364.1 EmrB/QacA subfamily drug resistance transporter [Pseudoclavibacter chungangensis]
MSATVAGRSVSGEGREQHAGAPADGAAVPRRTLVLLFCSLMLAMLLASLNNTLLSSAVPTIVGELRGVEHMSWVITSFILASTIVMPIYGKLSDLFGRRPLLVTAILLFMAGSVIGALAQSIEVLVVARVVQGLGGGGLMILSQAAIADVVPARERGKYMGIMGGVFAFSSVAGPLLGGWLTEGPGWRWVFWFNLPLGLAALLGAIFLLRLPKRRRHDARVDLLGMIVLAAATTAIVLVSIWGGTTLAWNSPVLIALLGAGVLFAALFALVERRASEPIMPLAMFRDRNFVLTTIASLVIGIAMFGVLGYLPTYLQVETGIGAAAAGLLMIPMMGCLLTTSIVTGQIVSRTGRYKLMPLIGTIVLAAGLVGLSFIGVDTPVWVVCVALGVIGTGIGASNQILTLIVQNAFPNAMVGTATAANNYFRQVGATLGSAVVGALFASRLADRLSDRLPADGAVGDTSSFTPLVIAQLPEPIHSIVLEAYNSALLPVYLWIAPLVLLGFVAVLFVVERPLATTVDAERPEDEGHVNSLAVTHPELDGMPATGAVPVTDASARSRAERVGGGKERAVAPRRRPPGRATHRTAGAESERASCGRDAHTAPTRGGADCGGTGGQAPSAREGGRPPRATASERAD